MLAEALFVAVGALQRLPGPLATHILLLPRMNGCACPPDALACLVVLVIRVYNQFAGHPC